MELAEDVASKRQLSRILNLMTASGDESAIWAGSAVPKRRRRYTYKAPSRTFGTAGGAPVNQRLKLRGIDRLDQVLVESGAL